jgi:large conductance mechanosensitive channel
VLKGFKDFLMRGNVVDLAVAVVIGTAFTAIVTSVTAHLIQPIIAAIGGSNVTGLAWTLVDGNEKSTIDFAAVITAVINFLIVAAVVYFMLVFPMKKIQERRKRGEEAGPSEPSDVELLIEIRDLLRQQQQPMMAQPQMQQPYQQPPMQQPYQQPTVQQQPPQMPPQQPGRGPGYPQGGPNY